MGVVVVVDISLIVASPSLKTSKKMSHRKVRRLLRAPSLGRTRRSRHARALDALQKVASKGVVDEDFARERVERALRRGLVMVPRERETQSAVADDDSTRSLVRVRLPSFPASVPPSTAVTSSRSPRMTRRSLCTSLPPSATRLA